MEGLGCAFDREPEFLAIRNFQCVPVRVAQKRPVAHGWRMRGAWPMSLSIGVRPVFEGAMRGMFDDPF